jgi:hypothetical protein
VGIGNASPSYKLDVTGTSRATTSFISPILNGATTLSLQTGGTTSLYIDASQNVGIGTTTSAYPLEVRKDATSATTFAAVRNSTATGAYGAGFLGVIGTSGTNYFQLSQSGSGDSSLFNANAGSLTFGTNNTERMRVDSSGYVGIGLTSITVGKLAVKSTADAYAGGGLYLQRQANTNGWSLLPATSNDLYVAYNSTDKGYFSTSTGAYTAISDATLKKNIDNISYGLDAVKALRPVEYLMIDEEDGSKKHLGFLAQEAQTVLPSSVSEMQGGKLGMDKSEIIPVLVKAIQELSAKVAVLELK